jgi:hypothetical protein
MVEFTSIRHIRKQISETTFKTMGKKPFAPIEITRNYSVCRSYNDLWDAATDLFVQYAPHIKTLDGNDVVFLDALW